MGPVLGMNVLQPVRRVESSMDERAGWLHAVHNGGCRNDLGPIRSCPLLTQNPPFATQFGPSDRSGGLLRTSIGQKCV